MLCQFQREFARLAGAEAKTSKPKNVWSGKTSEEIDFKKGMGASEVGGYRCNVLEQQANPDLESVKFC